MSSNKIIIAGIFPFPHGAAASARVKNIALGFYRNDWEVYILPSEIKTYEEEVENNHYFKLISPVPKVKNKSRIDQFLDFNNDQAMLFKNTILQNKINFTFLYGDSYFLLNKYIKVCKQFNVKTILDIVEDRKRLISVKSLKDPLIWNTLLGSLVLYKRTDYICTISYSLFKKYEKIGEKTLLFPGLEDYQDSSILKENVNKNNVVLYVGALTNRDNPIFLYEFMKAALLIDTKIKLVIAGKYNNHSTGKKFAEFLLGKLGENVELVGEITNTALFEWKQKADYFILPRKDNLAEKRAFPTRMVEFAKYKKPMILEGVGDITHYFKHMENAFICFEGSIIKEDLLELLTKRNLADTIGTAGFNTCKTNFQCENVISNLIKKITDEK